MLWEKTYVAAQTTSPSPTSRGRVTGHPNVATDGRGGAIPYLQLSAASTGPIHFSCSLSAPN